MRGERGGVSRVLSPPQQVDQGHRSRGVGTRLLHHVAEWCRAEGVRRIDVDDMSARHRLPHNVYVRAGFVYYERVGPEMHGSPAAVQRATQH